LGGWKLLKEVRKLDAYLKKNSFPCWKRRQRGEIFSPKDSSKKKRVGGRAKKLIVSRTN